MDLTFRLVNVFSATGDPFSGNCVAVFEDASALQTEQMQALSAQINNESVFILPRPDVAETRVRFFSPAKETGFAGSASLATAHVVRQLQGGHGDVVIREVDRGKYSIHQQGDLWVAEGRTTQASILKASPQILASLVGVGVEAIAGDVMTMDSGAGGIVLPLRSVEDVRDTNLDARMLHSYAMLLNTEPQVYVWAPSKKFEDTIYSRMFYGPRGGVLEVAATGSGGAHLGAWLAAHGEKDIHRRVVQGREQGGSRGPRSNVRVRVRVRGVAVGARLACHVRV